MRILMIETGGWGGIWHYTCCLGNAFYERGLNLYVASSGQPEKPFELKFKTLQVFRRGNAYFSNWFRLLRVIDTLRPDLLHFQSWFSARKDWIPLRLLSVFKKPFVLTVHNLLPHDLEEKYAPFMFWAFKNIYRSASALIAHSRSNKAQLIGTYGISSGAITVIRHGNYGFFTRNLSPHASFLTDRYAHFPKNRRLFLIFGAIRQYKGIDLALEAMKKLGNLQNIHLIVAGKPYGDTLNRCRIIADELGVSEHVTFIPGYLTDQEIAELHTLADVILFPYREIFQSGSLQIALAFGKPVIATRVGSFPETLNETNAWIVEPDSSTAIAQGMQKASKVSSDILALMGKESRRLSEEDHDWRSIAEQTISLYRRLLISR